MTEVALWKEKCYDVLHVQVKQYLVEGISMKIKKGVTDG